VSVDADTIELDGSPVFLRRAAGPDPTPLLLHGVPMSSDDWVPLIERTGAVAPDLPGYGRSGKGGQLDYTLAGQADFIARLLDAVGLGTVRLVAHDWSAGTALRVAAAHPERIERVVLVAPLGPGADTRRIIRTLRRRLAGELAIGATSKRLLGRRLDAAGWPVAGIDALWTQFDPGTQRALVRLARSGEVLGPRPDVPVEIAFGAEDPWWPDAVAAAWRTALPDAPQHAVPGGHWPWLESPEAADALAARIAS
jgi:pimeloyl-ACP methyl ester carboxylesterase